MASWSDVGDWLTKNGSSLLGLAGAVATGNVPAAVASVASMVTQATGETQPAAALAKLQADPATMVRLEEIAKANEADIRSDHRALIQMQLEDAQKEQEEQQKTIRGGDTATDEYVRRTRPMMARWSFFGTLVYTFVFEGAKVFAQGPGASMDMAMVLLAPAGAYLGFRTWDKFNSAKLQSVRPDAR